MVSAVAFVLVAYVFIAIILANRRKVRLQALAMPTSTGIILYIKSLVVNLCIYRVFMYDPFVLNIYIYEVLFMANIYVL